MFRLLRAVALCLCLLTAAPLAASASSIFPASDISSQAACPAAHCELCGGGALASLSGLESAPPAAPQAAPDLHAWMAMCVCSGHDQPQGAERGAGSGAGAVALLASVAGVAGLVGRRMHD